MDQVIAIDGPSASGKSTLARKLALRLNIPCVNTGSMFRAVAWAADQRHIDWTDEKGLVAMIQSMQMEYKADPSGNYELCCNGSFPGEALRTEHIASGASAVGKLPAVRNELKQQQRKMSKNSWIVMEGRDIGTVIFPDAQFKFFITATPLERARRRLAQEGDAAGASLEEVAAQIAARDEADQNRAVAPLKAAADAEIIDNSDMMPEDVLNLVYEKVCHAVL